MPVIEPYFAQHTWCTLLFHPHLRAPPSFGWSGRILCSHIQFPSLGKPWKYLPDFKTHPESYPPGLFRATLLSFSWIAAPPCLVPKTLFHTNTLQITPSSKCSVAPWLCLDVSVDCKGPAWLTASMTPSVSAPSVPAALVPYPHGWAHHSFCSRSLRALTPSLTRMNRLQCRSSSSLDLFDAAIPTSPCTESASIPAPC